MSHSHSNLHDPARRRAERIALWRAPVAVGVLSLAGLLVGLVYDGPGDALSWIALGIPVAVMLWYGWLRKPPRRD